MLSKIFELDFLENEASNGNKFILSLSFSHRIAPFRLYHLGSETSRIFYGIWKF